MRSADQAGPVVSYEAFEMCGILQQTDLWSLFTLARIWVFLFEMRVCVLSEMYLFKPCINLRWEIPSSFLILLLCKTGKILWPSSAGQTVHCLRKLHFQSLISVYLFVCVLLLQKKVNRLGVSPLSRRDQNMCSTFSQFFSSPMFILTFTFWPCCGFSAASLGWCAVETHFRQICLPTSLAAFFPALLHCLSE